MITSRHVADSRNVRAPVQVQDSFVEGVRIAVLLPCFNEERAIAQTIAAFAAALPTATVYVYDNNSRDNSIAMARAHGATVRSEPTQGKGNVV